MGCFLADRRSSIRAAISACLCRADCVEKPRQSSAMPVFFSLPARQIRRGYDHVIELLRSVVARGNHPALHMVPYRTMPYAKTKKSMAVDGFTSHEPRTTSHCLSRPGKSGANMTASLSSCGPLWLGGTTLPCIWCHIEQCLTQKPCRGAHVGRPLRATSHEPL